MLDIPAVGAVSVWMQRMLHEVCADGSDPGLSSFAWLVRGCPALPAVLSMTPDCRPEAQVQLPQLASCISNIMFLSLGHAKV